MTGLHYPSHITSYTALAPATFLLLLFSKQNSKNISKLEILFSQQIGIVDPSRAARATWATLTVSVMRRWNDSVRINISLHDVALFKHW